MSNIGNKYKVGVFAVVAFAILILGLVSLGTLKYFRTTWDFMTVVSASVQGLEKGAKVKIKGVTIGSVEKIQLGPEMKVTYIYMKFDPEAFSKVASLKYNLVGLSSQEMRALFGHVPVYNTLQIAERCNGNLLESHGLHFPAFPIPGNATASQYLRELVMDGLKARYGRGSECSGTTAKTTLAAYFPASSIARIHSGGASRKMGSPPA